MINNGKRHKLTIPTSTFVIANLNGTTEYLLVEKKFDEQLFKTAGLFTNALFTTPRALKYLALYKVYENLTNKKERDLTLSSIRHSIAHDPSKLTNINVVNKLNELFGSTAIDTDLYKDKKQLFKSYWDMWIEIDKILVPRLITYLGRSTQFLGKYRRVK